MNYQFLNMDQKMKHSILIALLIALLALPAYAQNDWHTYPRRAMSELVDQHSAEKGQKSDMLISADPFPSKTVAVYTGKHRPVAGRTADFIKLWAISRGVPQNAAKLAEEYLFKEKDKEYWMPAVSKLVPYLEKELKEGDEAMIYYFFLGGYNAKTLQDKDTSGAKKIEGLPNRMDFVFVLEEFQKPKPVNPVKAQTLSEAIDKSFKIPAGAEFALDPRQVKSSSRVIYTGEIRKTSEKKLLVIGEWAASIGEGGGVALALSREALFREGEKEYWIPVLSTVLENMEQQLVKGDTVLLSTLLAGGIRRDEGIEWAFFAGVFVKDK
jgi:hypothetical protein